MSGITVIKGWYDTRYVESSTEIPPVGHVLTNPDVCLEGPFNPSKDKEFSEIRLEIPFSEAMNLSYLELQYSFNNGEDEIFYAWVDDVRLMSDSQDAPMVSVSYHIDPWRTFNSKLRYGSGFVRRRPSQATDYWQNYPYRYTKMDSTLKELAAPSDGLWWAIVAMNRTTESASATAITGIVYAVIPFYSDPSSVLKINDAFFPASEVGQTHTSLSYSEIRSGSWDEFMGVNPQNIISVSVCPFNPTNVEYTITDGEIDFTNIHPGSPAIHVWYVQHHNTSGVYWERKIGWLESRVAIETATGRSDILFPVHTQSIDTLTSTEEHPLRVIGFNGEPVTDIPFGMTIGPNYTYRMVGTPLNCSIEYRMTGNVFDNVVGLTFAINLPTLDANSNAWSEYVYSGQRDYDIKSRNINTVTSMISGGLSNGMMGGLIGGLSGTAEYDSSTKQLSQAYRFSKFGALKAGGAMMGASLVAGAVEMGIINPLMQQAEDKLHANQPSSIITAGSGIDIITNCTTPKLIRMKFDDESQAIINANKEVAGVSFGQSVSDCTELINAGGPLQITNLIVNGNVPVAVKNWVINKFAAGVRIIAR